MSTKKILNSVKKLNPLNKKDRANYLISTFFLFLLYFATAKFGLSFNPVSGFATLVWPPTGIAMAVLLIYGYRLWPGITIGAFLVNYLTGAKIPVALGISLGNTLEAIIGAYFLNHVGFRASLERVKDVWALIVIAAVATLVSAIIGPATLLLGGAIGVAAYFKTLLIWWVGDILGALIIAPLIFVWSIKPNFKLNFFKSIELVVYWGLILLTGFVSFRGLFGIDTNSLPILYIVFPPLILLSLRFRQKESVSAIFILSVLAIWGIVEGKGAFAGPVLNQSLLLLQGFMATIAVTFMFLTASIGERKMFDSRKDEIIRVASHEFRTPIATLKGYSQLLKEHLKSKEDKQLLTYSKNIEQQTNRLNRLVEDLLGVAKLSLGELSLKYETFEIGELVVQIAQDLQNISPTHKIIVKKVEKVFLNADKSYISLVINNLINNAVKFSPSRSQVIIKMKKEVGFVELSIKDFGVGIDKGSKKQVFEKYYQDGNSISSEFHGFGLGLYISYEIIKRHKGKIWAKSIKGKGSTFTFKLPISR